MSESEGLKEFDFRKVDKPGKFVKFVGGESVTLRVLTKDPVMQEKEFTGKNGEINLSTKFCFVVYNFTAEKAQILSAGAKMAKTFQRVANDPDFGANLQKCDIKISAEGEMLERVYDINVLRHSGNEKTLTSAMIEEAKAIDLERDVQPNRGRASEWEPTTNSGYDQAKEEANKHREPTADEEEAIQDLNDEPINLDDIPF